MAFSSILRRSAQRAAPLVSRAFIAQRPFSTSVANKYSILSPHLRRAAASVPTTRRHFSSDSSADSKLLEVLGSEIECVEQSDDMGKTVEVPDDFPFTVKDNVGEQTVTLTREYGTEKIAIEVSMPNLVTGDEDEEDDEETQAPSASLPLLVTVQKKDGPFLEFDCTATADEISINNLSLKNPETEDQLSYEGPDFFDLDENLQKALHKYLEIRGVKPSTTNFLHEYMIEKDNREYVKWLKDVKKFVEV